MTKTLQLKNWHGFINTATGLDTAKAKPVGWHWFWGLYHLHHELNKLPDFDFKKIQDAVPQNHWLKEISTPNVPEYLRTEVGGLALYSSEPFNKIDFTGARFNNYANFSNYIFPIDVFFTNAVFHDQANFSNAIFLGNAYFTNTTFSKTTNFTNAVFNAKTANFSDATFKKIINFGEATFEHYANFKNTKFQGRTNFQLTEFKLHAPRFYSASFTNEMTWIGIKLPKFERSNDTETKQQYDKRIGENQNAYENLSTKLGNQKKYHDRYLFFCEEMRCRRRLEKPLFTRFAFWLYEKIANYGYGVERAFACWLWHMAIGIIAILAVILANAWWGCWQHNGWELGKSLLCSIPVSLANANPYTFIGFENGTLEFCYSDLKTRAPIGFGIIRVFQTIFGIIILFLFALTLRVRFRLAQSGAQK